MIWGSPREQNSHLGLPHTANLGMYYEEDKAPSDLKRSPSGESKGFLNLLN